MQFLHALPRRFFFSFQKIATNTPRPSRIALVVDKYFRYYWTQKRLPYDLYLKYFKIFSKLYQDDPMLYRSRIISYKKNLDYCKTVRLLRAFPFKISFSWSQETTKKAIKIPEIYLCDHRWYLDYLAMLPLKFRPETRHFY